MMIDQAYRLATDNEIAFYADRLYPQRIIADILWDFPPEARRISEQSRPVLQRRLRRLSLPRRRVVAASLLAQEHDARRE